MPKAWNVNSDRFETLYFKNSKKKKIETVRFETTSEKRKDFKAKRKYTLAKKGKVWIVQNANFKEDIIPPMNLFPASVAVHVMGEDGVKVCEQNIEFEVVK